MRTGTNEEREEKRKQPSQASTCASQAGWNWDFTFHGLGEGLIEQQEIKNS